MNKQFAHLHLHTDYSLLDGANKIGPLAKRAADLQLPAVAITDHGNLFGALQFYHKMKEAGVKPIIGMEGYLAHGSRFDKSAAGVEPGEKATNHIVLLAKNLTGYHNLVKLSSFAYTEGFWRKPRFDRELLAKHSEGLIALSACVAGVPPQLLLHGKFDEAARAALEFQDIMGKGNYYLEIQDHGLEIQQRIRWDLVDLSRRTGIPLVATNDAHYLMPEDARAHDILLCIGTGKTVTDPNRLSYGPPNFYVRSPEEMWTLFAEHPEWLTRTLEIAEMCDLTFPKAIDQVPLYPVPDGQTVDSYFEFIAREGFADRLWEVWQPKERTGALKYPISRYQERLNHEIEIIKRMGFAGYFLIVWDFIRYAKGEGIPVGPGRGSAAGSLVAYAMQITDVDPIQYDLLFERFLNPDRVSMPDIDVDFCVRGRQQVIDYVSDLYGRQNVSQIVTFGTLASKAAIKDVGRALDLPYAEVDKVAKMIPPPVRGRNTSISDALKQNPELKALIEEDPKIDELITIARKLEGCARHTSVHAAGVVISPQPMHELVPICKNQNDEIITQYAMTDLEKLGMLKMDFLALTTLTIIEDCLRSIEREEGSRPDLSQVPLEDEATLNLFRLGHLAAIFQFESSGMMEICRKLKPESLEDLCALNALYRPGPLDGGMVDDYIERRHGRASVSYIVPEMEPILRRTFGVLIYQEEIMQLAQALAGYSLSEADLMRRAMGKKKKEEMAKHEDKFINGAIEHGLSDEDARTIFNLMAQFADYGFNRSHSLAYSYLAFQAAYLKAHYPTHFYAAVLSNEHENTEKVARYTTEMKHFGIHLLPPDVNASHESFTAHGSSVRFGLAAIKGLGAASVLAIIHAREQGGNFKSVFGFTSRVEKEALNRRVLESLVKAGAFDSLHDNRAALFAVIDQALGSGSQAARDRDSGQGSLFSLALPATESDTLSEVAPWSRQQLLAYEKAALGFYASGHPLDEFVAQLSSMTTANADTLSERSQNDIVAMAGLIVDLTPKSTKRGDRFALLRLEDQFGSVKVVCWPEQYQTFQTVLTTDQPVIVRGRLEIPEDGAPSLIVMEIGTIEQALARAAKSVLLLMPKASVTDDHLHALSDLCRAHRGQAAILIEVQDHDLTARIRPIDLGKVNPTPQFKFALSAVCPAWQVSLLTSEDETPKESMKLSAILTG